MVNPQTRIVSGQIKRPDGTPFTSDGTPLTIQIFDAISSTTPAALTSPLPANGTYRIPYSWQSTGGRNGPNLLVRVFNQGTPIGEAEKRTAGMQERLDITVTHPAPHPPLPPLPYSAPSPIKPPTPPSPTSAS